MVSSPATRRLCCAATLAVVSGRDGADSDAAFPKDHLRSLECGAPDGIVERRGRRVEAGDPGVDDRPGAVDAGKEGGGDVRARCRDPPPRRFEYRMTLGVLHPYEASIARVAFIEV